MVATMLVVVVVVGWWQEMLRFTILKNRNVKPTTVGN